MIIPVGPEGGNQQLVQCDRKVDGRMEITELMGVRYVPLISGIKKST